MENNKKGLLSKLYFKMMGWASHPRAPKYLAAVSFAESSFFPVPPDIMLLPMVLSRPKNAYTYAFLATLFSILGGMLGYIIGHFAFETIGMAIINYFHFQHGFEVVKNWFIDYGFYAVLLAGFTPIPYKLFTITAGLVKMNFPMFVLASIFGRGMRFFLVALLMKTFGKKLEPYFIKYLDRVGWALLLLCGVVILIIKFFK